MNTADKKAPRSKKERTAKKTIAQIIKSQSDGSEHRKISRKPIKRMPVAPIIRERKEED